MSSSQTKKLFLWKHTPRPRFHDVSEAHRADLNSDGSFNSVICTSEALVWGTMAEGVI